MIRQGAAHYDTLRDYAAGYSNDLDFAAANVMAPWVVTGIALGFFKRWDESNAFALGDTSRAVGGPARRLEFLATDPTFNCQPQALECPIDDTERPGLKGDADLNQQAKAAAVVQSCNLASADKAITKAKTVTAEAGLGQWANAANDPVGEIDSVMRTIETNSGRLPNWVVFGASAWERFKNHTKVIGRHPTYVLVGGQVFMPVGLLANPTCKFLVGTMAKQPNPGVNTKTNLIGDDVFIYFASENPTIWDSSWMKRFTVRPNGINEVRTYRDEKVRSDILAVDWSEDLQITCSASAGRITTSG
jgi:hypothetical protein